MWSGLPEAVFGKTPVLALDKVSRSISVHPSTAGSAGNALGSTAGDSKEAFSIGIDADLTGTTIHKHDMNAMFRKIM